MNEIELIEHLYAFGLEKFAGDETQAKDFVEGFVKEAAGSETFLKAMAGGAAKAIGGGVAAAGLGLGLHGIASAMANANNNHLRAKFESVLEHVKSTSVLLRNAPHDKVKSYGETIFKFAPHVATDPNLMSAILSNAIHGEGVDPMTIRNLGDLESRYLESRKGSMFSFNSKGF